MQKKRIPVLFIGHGSPENAFADNEFSQRWKALAASFGRPRAIVVVSAHWTNHMTTAAGTTSITTTTVPETLHDFYGFPPEFFAFTYPASGDPVLADKIISLVEAIEIKRDARWGLDHGAWSVLAQMYPSADIPVVQLSIDEDLPREALFAIGRELAPLRDQDVLILGSGNIVHNLGVIRWGGSPYSWAVEFDTYVATALSTKDTRALTGFESHPLATLALPTVEHYLPLLYVVGAAEADSPRFFCEEIVHASLSMRCVAYGLD